MLGDNVRANEYAREAYSLVDQLSPADQAGALQVLVSAEAEAGRLGEARAHADELCRRTEHAAGTLYIEALWASATVLTRQGDYAGAQRLLERALQRLEGHGDLMLSIRLRLAAASLHLQTTPPLTDRARAGLDAVAPVVELVGTDLHEQQLLSLRAHLAFEEGRTAEARALWERVAGQPLLLSFRDQVRFRALGALLLVVDGEQEAGMRALQELAQQSRDALNVELEAAIWRSLAKTLAETRHGPVPMASS
jgi:tetratricopeptide (TPR) repeat protein